MQTIPFKKWTTTFAFSYLHPADYDYTRTAASRTQIFLFMHVNGCISARTSLGFQQSGGRDSKKRRKQHGEWIIAEISGSFNNHFHVALVYHFTSILWHNVKLLSTFFHIRCVWIRKMWHHLLAPVEWTSNDFIWARTQNLKYTRAISSLANLRNI